MPIEPTELVEMDPDTVHFVKTPASRRGPLLAKAEAEVEEVLTESQAAMLASRRAGERMSAIAKARGEHTDPTYTLSPETDTADADKPSATIDTPQRSGSGHDTPVYDAQTPKPFDSGHDKPNSTINPSGKPYDGAGVNQAEVDAIYASLRKEALGLLEKASLLLSIAEMKAGEDYDTFCKAKYSADDKKKMLAAGKAIKNAKGDPSYPIGDKDDLDKAIKAVGRGGTSHDRIRAYIMKRAKALGALNAVPEGLDTADRCRSRPRSTWPWTPPPPWVKCPAALLGRLRTLKGSSRPGSASPPSSTSCKLRWIVSPWRCRSATPTTKQTCTPSTMRSAPPSTPWASWPAWPSTKRPSPP